MGDFNTAVALRQALAVTKLELRKTFLSRRGWWIWILAILPVVLTTLHSLIPPAHARCTIGRDTMAFAAVFQFFYLRLVIFFGCAGIFANLVRGEVLEKSLHYYFMVPVRREVLLMGKYFAGLITAAVLFGGSVALSFFGLYLHFGSAAIQEFLFTGPGGEQFLWYMVVVALACAGYGGVFLAFGLVVQNPMIPAAVVMIWEGMNALLPAVLKKLSILFYLKSLLPVEMPVSGVGAILAVVTEPTPAWIAIPGLLSVTLLLLIVAALRIRKMEISYVTE